MAMSRGLGHIQQKLVAILERRSGAIDAFDLAAKVYRLRPNKKGITLLNDRHLVSVRRALRGLEKTGKVCRVTRRRRTWWANEQTGLWSAIKEARDRTVVLAALGDIDGLKAHVLEKAPLFKRAAALGIDIDADTPPKPRRTK